ncbi:aminotransferase class III-fold pyridoxal phosphate-dependent enzyme, partial [Mesorhizobium sp. M1C.F.Ca.ET.144.01.1.1]
MSTAQSVETVSRPNLFHFTRRPQPMVDRADGIYLWDKSGRRYIDGSSGAVNVNVGHGNSNVIDAMKRQLDRVSFAYIFQFENEQAVALARELADRLP